MPYGNYFAKCHFPFDNLFAKWHICSQHTAYSGRGENEMAIEIQTAAWPQNTKRMENVADAVKHMRKRLKIEGVKARVRKSQACGVTSIQVISPSFEEKFTVLDHYKICCIAKMCGLHLQRGERIDERVFLNAGISPDEDCREQWNFVYHDPQFDRIAA